MSEDATTIVEISVRGSAAVERAEAVRDWLLDAGVIKPNPSIDPVFQRSLYLAGLAASTAFPGYQHDAVRMLAGPHSGVDIITERQAHHPVENYQEPACPTCGTPIDGVAHHALIVDWLAGTEPTVTCASCGRPSLIGDWPGEWTFQVGELAVRFNNWPRLSQAFIGEIGHRLGPRWRVVREHT